MAFLDQRTLQLAQSRPLRFYASKSLVECGSLLPLLGRKLASGPLVRLVNRRAQSGSKLPHSIAAPPRGVSSRFRAQLRSR